MTAVPAAPTKGTNEPSGLTKVLPGIEVGRKDPVPTWLKVRMVDGARIGASSPVPPSPGKMTGLPFAVRPMLTVAFGMDEQAFQRFLDLVLADRLDVDHSVRGSMPEHRPLCRLRARVTADALVQPSDLIELTR